MTEKKGQNISSVIGKLQKAMSKLEKRQVVQVCAAVLVFASIVGLFIHRNQQSQEQRLFAAMSSSASEDDFFPTVPLTSDNLDKEARYIVFLKEKSGNPKSASARVKKPARQKLSQSIEKSADRLEDKYGGERRAILTSVANGYIADLTLREAYDLSKDPSVKKVMGDRVSKVAGTQLPASWGLPWGLDRIDQKELPLNNKYEYDDQMSGKGVNVYVMDTTILTSHPEFEGRASLSGFRPTSFNADTDCQVHGTVMASVIAGKLAGVAKEANIFGVPVAHCNSGSYVYWTEVMAAIEWLTNNAVKPAVVNMSLNPMVVLPSPDEWANELEASLRNSMQTGLVYVHAAGNGQQKSCEYTPVRMPEMITVGGIDSSGNWYGNSGYGACVSLSAPAIGVLAATSHTTFVSPPYPQGYGTGNGTSHAAAHISGVVAGMLSKNPSLTQTQVKANLLAEATSGQVVGAPSGTPNLLVYANPNTPTPTPACSYTTPTLTNTTATPSVAAGTPQDYTVVLKNNDSANCPTSTYDFAPNIFPAGWTMNPSSASVTVAPGAQGTKVFTVASVSTASPSNYQVSIKAAKSGMASVASTINLPYNIPTPVPVCTNTNPTMTWSPTSGTAVQGSSLTFTMTLKNNDSQTDCDASTYNIAPTNLPNGWTMTPNTIIQTLTPGSQASKQITITAPATASVNQYSINVKATKNTNAAISAQGAVTFNVTVAPTTVSGTVTSPTGAPVALVTMTLRSPSGKVYTTKTISNGTYLFPDVAKGETYTLSASNRRYRFESKNLTVNSNVFNVNFVGLE